MQHNIRRNKKVIEYLQQQMKRLNWPMPVSVVFTEFIFENLSVVESKEVLSHTQNLIDETLLDQESVFIETIKFIGILEVSNSEDEVRQLINRRKELKHGKPLTDFDKILKAIMAVPNMKDKESK